jgi:hypothetical protein
VVFAGDEIAIVDRFSGRVLEGRKYSDGLQQSVQVKEGLPCSSQSQVIATITYQSLFNLFGKLSGMTGTAMTDFKDFLATYDLAVVPIPTALPNARRDYPDAIFRSWCSCTARMYLGVRAWRRLPLTAQCACVLVCAGARGASCALCSARSGVHTRRGSPS